MLDILLLAVGRLKESYYREAAAEYAKRLQPYARFRQEEVKAEPFGRDVSQAKEKEGGRLQAAIDRHQGAAVFLLSEGGTAYDSHGFSRFLESQGREIVLVIAGTAGFSDRLSGRYPKLSLSPLTFPHELARVVLLEQVYRAATIINKKDYHY